ncbi:MAG: aminodeoxychorismate synthase component I [Gemmatimonadales bacterium]
MSAPFVEELVPAPDPLATLSRFADLPHPVFLDSAAASPRLGAHSFLAADPVAVLRSERGVPDPLAWTRRALAPYARAPLAGLPPFQGGVAGYLAYEWGASLEQVPRPGRDDVPVPDAVLGLYDWVIAWDHAAGRAWIISTGIGEAGSGKREAWAAERLAWVKEAVGRTGGQAVRATTSTRPPDRPTAQGLQSDFTRDEYVAGVSRVRDYILAGDIFQANLAQRFQARLWDTPLELYRRLRRVSPAPFAAFLGCGDFAVASISPERFLRVDPAAGTIESRPIKGTRPRGADPAADEALARALAASDKDRAENVMIVDLVRNDVSRVARPGSVRVPELCVLERHPTVHHLVSTVTAELDAGRDALDLLAACFPGGSVTGAPKVRAMQIIAQLERAPRGVYCGAIGYLSVTGALDTSVAIRTAVARDRAVVFHAGAGIVADSDPETEYQETRDKAAAFARALGPLPDAP